MHVYDSIMSHDDLQMLTNQSNNSNLIDNTQYELSEKLISDTHNKYH